MARGNWRNWDAVVCPRNISHFRAYKKYTKKKGCPVCGASLVQERRNET